ncbi:hypothetical protein [Pantoea ananatis]|uniref:hypothetical protein n=1 Tax=Pantoea ananas TaxID=553 RepID=UPI00234FC46B|nr:hypothetical protein [Pantoea ananatis]MDC7861228.1 hypothetical protein [Pantoea ananatis]
MDEVDLAQQFEQAIITAALESRKKSPVSPDGKCIWYKVELAFASTEFCSADCGEDYHKHEREMKLRVD